MSRHQVRWHFSAQRRSARRLWFGALIVASLLLLVLSRSDTVITYHISNAFMELTAPIHRMMAGPIARIRAATSEAGSYRYLVDEISRLREENRNLRGLHADVAKLESKLKRYEKLLNATPERQHDAVTARVIADAGSPFVRTVLIDAGSERSIDLGQAVIGAEGLVGRTVSVGHATSRVLLLNDLNSKVPVRVEPHGFRAILAGNNTDFPTLEFLPLGARLEEGDRVVTSGHGGMFPSGLAVGVVHLREGKAVRVELSEKPGFQQFVRVLHARRGNSTGDSTVPYEPSAGVSGGTKPKSVALESGTEAQ